MDRVWLDTLSERPIKAIRYSELIALIGNLAVAGKTLNNYLIPLRGVFEFARRDGAIVTNPASVLENARVQRPAPDPFTLPEVEAILDNLAEREDAQVVNYFRAAFFAGFRPSELIALHWSDVDFGQRTVRVQRAVVRGRAKDSTKRPIWCAMSSLATAPGPLSRPNGCTRSSPAKRSSGIRPPAAHGLIFDRS